MDRMKMVLQNVKAVKVDFSSWYTVFIGTVIVWILSCSKWCYNVVSQHRSTLAVLLAMGYLMIVFYIVAIKGKRDTKTILGLILLAGLLLRSYYVLAAPFSITKHDAGTFKGLATAKTAKGHFGYIDYIYKHRALPDFDPRKRWCYYNPPGFHILGALMLGISQMFRVPEPLCYETIQVVTLCFSNLTVWTGCRILKEFSIKDKWLLLMTALLSVHPFFAVMAVTLTNDSMAMYFMMLAVWYTIRWQKEPELKKIIVIAFAVGFGMMAKLNAGLLAFAIGTVFLYVFFQNRREWKKYVVQFAVFLVICAPIGLFNPVRNLINYDIPLTYVQKANMNNGKYMADATMSSLFGIPPRSQVSYPFITLDPAFDRNAWIQLLKTALFDELMPEQANDIFLACASVLLWISLLLAILMNLIFIRSICKKDTMNTGQKLLCAIAYVTLLVSFMSFCLQEPFTFTMEYRYISISILFPVIGTALWLQGGSENGLFQKRHQRMLKNIVVCQIVGFIVLAAVINLELIAWSHTFL